MSEERVVRDWVKELVEKYKDEELVEEYCEGVEDVCDEEVLMSWEWVVWDFDLFVKYRGFEEWEDDEE